MRLLAVLIAPLLGEDDKGWCCGDKKWCGWGCKCEYCDDCKKGMVCKRGDGKKYMWMEDDRDVRSCSGGADCGDSCQTEYPDAEAMCNQTDCKGCAECLEPLCPEAPDDSSRCTSQLLGFLLVFCTDRL